MRIGDENYRGLVHEFRYFSSYSNVPNLLYHSYITHVRPWPGTGQAYLSPSKKLLIKVIRGVRKKQHTLLPKVIMRNKSQNDAISGRMKKSMPSLFSRIIFAWFCLEYASRLYPLPGTLRKNEGVDLCVCVFFRVSLFRLLIASHTE